MILRRIGARYCRSAAFQSPKTACRYASTLKDLEPIGETSNLQPTNPSDGSSSIPRALNTTTQSLEAALESAQTASKTLEAEINAHSGVPTATNPTRKPRRTRIRTQATNFEKSRHPAPYEDLKHLYKARKAANEHKRIGTRVQGAFDPDKLFQKPPTADEITLPMLLANQTHLGHATSLWHPANSSYIFGVREGIHIISLETTFAYLRRAAKVVQEVARRGGIILFLGTRKGWGEIVVNAAKLAGGYHIFDRWTPGSLTNGQQILASCAVKIVDLMDEPLHKFDALLGGDKQVLRPDLVICLNPLENEVCLHECGLYNVPTIGVVDTDCNPSWVTYPIPANDDSLRSVGLISGVLGRAGQEGQRLRLMQAKTGKIEYDTRAVKNYIEMLEEVQALDVNESDPGGATSEAKA